MRLRTTKDVFSNRVVGDNIDSEDEVPAGYRGLPAPWPVPAWSPDAPSTPTNHIPVIQKPTGIRRLVARALSPIERLANAPSVPDWPNEREVPIPWEEAPIASPRMRGSRIRNIRNNV